MDCTILLGSENKRVDQLPDYRAADLRLWFGICKKKVCLHTGEFSAFYPFQQSLSC